MENVVPGARLPTSTWIVPLMRLTFAFGVEASLSPIETAAIELSASGEAFVLFRNVETDGLSVLVRQAGQFGLVEPGK